MQAQLLRRGGVKGRPRVSPNLVGGRIAQLRAQHKEEEKEKRKVGQAPPVVPAKGTAPAPKGAAAPAPATGGVVDGAGKHGGTAGS